MANPHRQVSHLIEFDAAGDEVTQKSICTGVFGFIQKLTLVLRGEGCVG